MKTGIIERESDSIRLFATLLLFWVMLNSSLAIDTFIIGVIASMAIAYFFKDSLSFLAQFNMSPQGFIAAAKYLGYFFSELIKSNLKLAAIVVSPSLPINPGIVKVRTGLKSSMGRLLLANSITLTPGTLTVGLEGEWLYIHWVTVEATDIDAATAKIVAGFEKHLEVMYG